MGTGVRICIRTKTLLISLPPYADTVIAKPMFCCNIVTRRIQYLNALGSCNLLLRALIPLAAWRYANTEGHSSLGLANDSSSTLASELCFPKFRLCTLRSLCSAFLSFSSNFRFGITS